MPSLQIAFPHGQRHPRHSRRALMTAPRPGRERPVHVEPLHAFADRWLALARRYKIAMVGVAGAAIAVYCPQNPFQSARAKHAHLGGHYPSRYNTSDTRCSFARLGCQEDPTTIDDDTRQATHSLDKLRFKLEASENIPPSRKK